MKREEEAESSKAHKKVCVLVKNTYVVVPMTTAALVDTVLHISWGGVSVELEGTMQAESVVLLEIVSTTCLLGLADKCNVEWCFRLHVKQRCLDLQFEYSGTKII